MVVVAVAGVAVDCVEMVLVLGLVELNNRGESLASKDHIFA